MIRIMVQRSLGSQIPDDVLRHNCELGVLTYDPQDPQLPSVVVYLGRTDFRGAAEASAGRAKRRSASGNWARNRSWRTSCRRRIAKK